MAMAYRVGLMVDLSMPRMDGWAALQAIRALARRVRLPVGRHEVSAHIPSLPASARKSVR